MTLPAMVLAAGRGTRMGALSEHTPKPLVQVAGRSLLDRILDHLEAVSTPKIVINMHHLADRIEAHVNTLEHSAEIRLSDERDALLETGGGVRKALPMLGENPFFVINGDALWVDTGKNTLERMQEHYDPVRMDILLLLAPTADCIGYEGAGDFTASADGAVFPIEFRGAKPTSPYVFAGVQITRPELYTPMPEGRWSNAELFRKAAATGRLYGMVLDGSWMHVGTPEAITEAEAKLAELGAA